MSVRHSAPVRGLLSTKASPLFEGRFGRMFRSVRPATFGATDDENATNLAALGAAMSAEFDPPKDGKDDEESGIPALYTYLYDGKDALLARRCDHSESALSCEIRMVKGSRARPYRVYSTWKF